MTGTVLGACPQTSDASSERDPHPRVLRASL